jgi:hypothetical protein
VFDDPNLVPDAGLVLAMALAQRAGLDQAMTGLTVDCPNAALKASCLVAGMLAGADSIDDMDLLRSGGLPDLFDGVRAPSTLGTFLRSFTAGHALQLDKAGHDVLERLAAVVPGLVADTAGVWFLDLDDSVVEVHGYHKQAAGRGHSGVNGLNLLNALFSSPGTAPPAAGREPREGKTASGSGSGQMAARAGRVAARLAGGGQGIGRADSAFHRFDCVQALRRQGLWFSITARQNKAVVKAIAPIPDTAWTPVHRPNAFVDRDTGRLVSDAEVAETDFTAFSSRRKADHVPRRLVVRRVKRLGDAPPGQDPLFDAHRFHALITDSTLTAVAADAVHRDHAIVEQAFAEFKGQALAHPPSGSYAANAAWAHLAAITFNLARALAAAAGRPRWRWATVTRNLIGLPGRIARSARRTTIHLPLDWPWQDDWTTCWHTAAPPGRTCR